MRLMKQNKKGSITNEGICSSKIQDRNHNFTWNHKLKIDTIILKESADIER